MKRFLYVPSVGKTTVADNEGYLEFCTLVDVLSARGEDVVWYVLVPSWVKDGLRPYDNLEYVYLDAVRDVNITMTAGFPAFEVARNFARRGGMRIIDGVLTNCVGYAAYLGSLLSDNESPFRVPVFVRDHVVRDFSHESFYDWLNLAHSYTGCHLAVRSDYESRAISSFLRQYSNPAFGRIFLDGLVKWPVVYDPVGYDVDSERCYSDVSDNAPSVLFCGGEYGIPGLKVDELKIAKKLFISGNILASLATRTPRYKVDKAFPHGDKSFLRWLNTSVEKDEYDREVKRGDFFVSVQGKGPSLIIEEELSRLIVGQVGIVPYGGLFVEKLGEGYPFYYNPCRLDEAVGMASWVADNLFESRKLVKSFSKDLMEKSDARIVAMDVWHAMAKEIDKTYRVHKMRRSLDGNRRSVLEVVYDVATKLGDHFMLDVFLDILEEHITWLKPFSRKGTLKSYGDVRPGLPTLYDLREMLDNCGWVDMGGGRGIVLQRVKDPVFDDME
jgi:hypothetical protein